MKDLSKSFEELERVSLDLADVVRECLDGDWHDYVFHLLRSITNIDRFSDDPSLISYDSAHVLIPLLIDARFKNLPATPIQKAMFQIFSSLIFKDANWAPSVKELIPSMTELNDETTRFFNDAFDTEHGAFLNNVVDIAQEFISVDGLDQFDLDFSIDRKEGETREAWRLRAAAFYGRHTTA